MNEDINVSWMNETIEELPEHQGMYKLFCLIQLKRRMTYSDMYVFTYALNKNKYKNNELELKERIIKDIILAKQHFEYISINLFNENSTAIAPDKELQQWFISELYPKLKLDSQIEILINNNDLGVG